MAKDMVQDFLVKLSDLTATTIMVAYHGGPNPHWNALSEDWFAYGSTMEKALIKLAIEIDQRSDLDGIPELLADYWRERECGPFDAATAEMVKFRDAWQKVRGEKGGE